MLAPLITREIVYRLLTGAQGDRLRQLAMVEGQAQPINRAIARLRRDYDRPLRIENWPESWG